MPNRPVVAMEIQDFMKALIRGDTVVGYDIRQVDKDLDTGHRGVKAKLMTIYSGGQFNGYVFRLVNITRHQKYKVDIIKEKLIDTKISVSKKTVSLSEDLEDLVVGSDFLVNCADSPSMVETTKIIDKYALKYNIPYCVAGGYNMHLGMIGPIIIPGKTASFQDFIDYQKSNDPLKDLEKIKDIEQTGSLGPIAGAVANIQVMEIFKFLIGKGSINLNKFAEVDFMNFGIEWRNFSQKVNLMD